MALLGLLALPIAGCEELCTEGAITWCPPGRSDLNTAPDVASLQVESWTPDSVPPLGGRVVGDLALVDHLTRFATRVQDLDGDDLLVEWDLDGDGEFEKGEASTDPGQRSVEAFRTYRAPGTFGLRFRASDFPAELGIPGETLRERPVAIIREGDNRRPVPAFTFNPRQARVGETVSFDAGASSDSDFFDNPPFNTLTYRWSFGDMTGALGETATHVYRAPGTYRVSLQVQDQFRRVAAPSAEQTLTVLDAGAPNSPPSARFSVVPAAR